MGFIKSISTFGLCLGALSNVVAAQSLIPGADRLPECALSCFRQSIPETGCNATDLACLCPSDAFRLDATLCVQAACTVKETLTSRNVTADLCNDPTEGDDRVITILAVFLGLAALAVVLRIIARILTKAYFWWDDLCNLFAMGGCIAYAVVNFEAVGKGMGKDIWFLEFHHVNDVVRDFFINMLLYTTTRFLVRSSIILFYLRVFPLRSDNKLGRILVATLIANVVYNLSFFLTVVFQCQPISYFWTAWEGEHEGHCGNFTVLAWVAAITGIIFDAWLLALPFPQLLALNLHWKKKIMGSMMFSVGMAVVVISFIRLKTINQFTRASNPTRDVVELIIWSGIELDVGVICPCLPSLRLLLRKIMPRIIGTTGNYEMGSVANGTRGGTGARKSVGVGNMMGSGIVVSMSVKTSQDSRGDEKDCSASVTGLVRDPQRERRDKVWDGTA
ncbi:hypothetical protein OQA88_11622 [Cercophora sp. LCS_1]